MRIITVCFHDARAYFSGAPPHLLCVSLSPSPPLALSFVSAKECKRLANVVRWGVVASSPPVDEPVSTSSDCISNCNQSYLRSGLALLPGGSAGYSIMTRELYSEGGKEGEQLENELGPSLLRGILACGSTTCRKTNRVIHDYFPLLSKLPLLTWLLETSEETLSSAAVHDFASMKLVGNLDKALTELLLTLIKGRKGMEKANSNDLNDIIKADVAAARLRMLHVEHYALRESMEEHIQEMSALKREHARLIREKNNECKTSEMLQKKCLELQKNLESVGTLRVRLETRVELLLGTIEKLRIEADTARASLQESEASRTQADASAKALAKRVAMLEICEAESCKKIAQLKEEIDIESKKFREQAGIVKGKSDEAKQLHIQCVQLRKKNREVVDELKSMEAQLAEVNVFLSSHRGEKMQELENQLASKSLQLAQCEEEKDGLERLVITLTSELQKIEKERSFSRGRSSGTVEAKDGI